MKNFKLNSKAVKLDFSLAVEIKTLDLIGWDFTDIYDEIMSQKEIDREEAEKLAYKTLTVELHVSGTPDKPITTYCVDKNTDYWNGISNGLTQDTGDDTQTIKDICRILDDTQLGIQYKNETSGRGFWDSSRDENENYIQAFIIF